MAPESATLKDHWFLATPITKILWACSWFFFSNLRVLLGSFDPEFCKNFRDSWNLPVGSKLADLLTKNWTLFLTLAVDFFNLAVLTQIKAVAKARDPKSPGREIQSGWLWWFVKSNLKLYSLKYGFHKKYFQKN